MHVVVDWFLQKSKSKKAKEVKQEIKEEKPDSSAAKEAHSTPKKGEDPITVSIKEEVDKDAAPMSPSRSEDGGPGSRRSRRILKEVRSPYIKRI